MTAPRPARWQRIHTFLADAINKVARCFAEGAAPPERRSARLAPLTVLEDRRLLSAAAVNPEFRVNTFIAGEQRLLPETTQAIALHPTTGAFLVVWSSKDRDGDGWGISGQRFDAQGKPQGSEFRVNSAVTGDQQNASAAIAADGSFVVTWADRRSGNWDIYARLFNVNGAAQGAEFRVNQTTTSDQLFPSVALDSAGSFLITYSGRQSGDWDVYARSFSSYGSPQGREFRINLYTQGDQTTPALAMSPDGSFVVAWASTDQDGNGWSVSAQRFSPGAVPQGSEFRVNTTTVKDQLDPTAATDINGNVVIAWASEDQDGDHRGVYAQRYDDAGTPQGNAFRVNTFTDKDQQYPAAAMNAGGFVIAWASEDQDGEGEGVYAQRFDSAGVALGSEFRVNSTTSNDQSNPAVAMDEAGRFVVAWDGNGPGDGQGVYARRFQFAGITVAPTAATSAPPVPTPAPPEAPPAVPTLTMSPPAPAEAKSEEIISAPPSSLPPPSVGARSGDPAPTGAAPAAELESRLQPAKAGTPTSAAAVEAPKQAALHVVSTVFDGRDPSLFNPPDAALVSGGVVSGEWSQGSPLTTHHSPLTNNPSPVPSSPSTFFPDRAAVAFAAVSLIPLPESSAQDNRPAAGGTAGQVMAPSWGVALSPPPAARAERWVEAQPVGPRELPWPGPVPALAAREAELITLAAPVAGARLAWPAAHLPADLLWAGLERAAEQADAATPSTELSGIALTGLLAGAGYVLLNTRAGYWLLSLLAARPLWRRFDPLEVLFAWEKESGQAGRGEEDESLVSLAGSTDVGPTREEASPS